MGNILRTTNEHPILEAVEGSIPGSIRMAAYQRASDEEKARRVVIDRGYVLGPDEHRSYVDILESMLSHEATERTTGQTL